MTNNQLRDLSDQGYVRFLTYALLPCSAVYLHALYLRNDETSLTFGLFTITLLIGLSFHSVRRNPHVAAAYSAFALVIAMVETSLISVVSAVAISLFICLTTRWIRRDYHDEGVLPLALFVGSIVVTVLGVFYYVNS